MDISWLPDLKALVTLPGISGNEDVVSRYLAKRLGEYADSVEIDSLGNVIARFGEPSSTAIAVLAHIDTVGLMVNAINGDGTLRVVRIGGVNYKALPGTTVRVGDHTGIIGVRSQHQAQSGDALESTDDIYIHVAPDLAVEITTPITYAPNWVEIGTDLIVSPYLDNRAGCAVLLEMAQQLSKERTSTVYLIGTVQEETTCVGAYLALQRVAPSAAIFVDGTVSHDTPDTRKLGSVKLGHGPVLTAFLYVSGLNGWHAHPALRQHLKGIAVEAGIPFQQDAVHGLMSDARAVTWLGIPSAIIGIPMRGKHSPAEMIHVNDVTHTIHLLTAALSRPLPNLQRG